MARDRANFCVETRIAASPAADGDGASPVSTLKDLAMDFEISPGQVKSLQKNGETFTLLDVREPWEYEASHIEGTKHIPMGDIPTRAHQELDPDAHIVVMCHRGVRSVSVTNWLRQQGYEKVQSMRGGIDGWARTVDPKVPLY